MINKVIDIFCRYILLMFLGFSLIASNAAASTVLVDISASWDESNFSVTDTLDAAYNPANPEFDGEVFEVAPSSGTETIELMVNTDGALVYSSGYTFNINGVDYTLAHDWYGYMNVELVNPYTFGTASWDNTGILHLVGVEGQSAALWTNSDISNSNPTKVAFRMFGSGDGLTADLFVGSWTYEEISSEFLIWEYFGGEEIRTNSYDVVTSVIPVPTAVWLFSSGLLGLVGVTRRKKV